MPRATRRASGGGLKCPFGRVTRRGHHLRVLLRKFDSKVVQYVITTNTNEKAELFHFVEC